MVGSVLILTWTDTRFPNYKVVFVNDVRSSTLASNHHQVVEFHTSGPLVAFYMVEVVSSCCTTPLLKRIDAF